jgi:serine protease inhibitor
MDDEHGCLKGGCTMGAMLKAVVFLLVIVILFGCADDPLSPKRDTPRELTATEQELVNSYNAFGFNLFREVTSQEEDINVFMSPLSVSMALGMTMNGADGATLEAMKMTLEFSGLTMEEIDQSYKSLMELLIGLDPEVQFQIANSIWYRLGLPFKQEFLDSCSYYFDAEVADLDFARPDAASIINQWVGNHTNGRIERIVNDPIDPLIVIFLINAIYFKGTWTTEFDPGLTAEDLFNLPDGSSVPCKMMQRPGAGKVNEFTYFANSRLQAVDLPYGNDLFSMTIVLPSEDTDIDSLIAGLDENGWNEIADSLSMCEGHLSMPRFKLEYETDLCPVLTTLGMGIAFSGGADFSRMCEGLGIFISQVKHKTFVKVDEKGTEAAAVTVVTGATGVGERFNMVVDRPFLFVIRENHSGTILFIGKIVDPGYE